MMGSKPKDITGQRFGRMTVLRDSGERCSDRGVLWLCKCDCGNEKIARGSDLKRGHVKSCGCLKREIDEKAININKSHKKQAEEQLKEGTKLDALTKKISKNNTSGVKGVSFDKNAKNWIALMTFKNKVVLREHFKNKQDAINARKEAEEKYFKPILEKYGKEQKS